MRGFERPADCVDTGDGKPRDMFRGLVDPRLRGLDWKPEPGGDRIGKIGNGLRLNARNRPQHGFVGWIAADHPRDDVGEIRQTGPDAILDDRVERRGWIVHFTVEELVLHVVLRREQPVQKDSDEPSKLLFRRLAASSLPAPLPS